MGPPDGASGWIRLPSFFVLRPLLVSVLFIWFACHLVVTAVFSFGGSPLQKAIWPGPTASIILVLVVPFMFFIDLRIKRLDVFLANLGISRRVLFWGVSLCALALEVLGTGMAGFFTSGQALQ